MVISLLMAHLELTDKQYFIEEYNMEGLLGCELQIYPKDTLRKIDQLLKTNKKLTVDAVMKANRTLGVVFSVVEIRLRL